MRSDQIKRLIDELPHDHFPLKIYRAANGDILLKSEKAGPSRDLSKFLKYTLMSWPDSQSDQNGARLKVEHPELGDMWKSRPCPRCKEIEIAPGYDICNTCFFEIISKGGD